MCFYCEKRIVICTEWGSKNQKEKLLWFFSGSSISREKNDLEGTCDSVFPRFRTECRCFSCSSLGCSHTGHWYGWAWLLRPYVWHQSLLLLRYLWHSQRWVEREPSEPNGRSNRWARFPQKRKGLDEGFDKVESLGRERGGVWGGEREPFWRKQHKSGIKNFLDR